jgi:hypothetical protein
MFPAVNAVQSVHETVSAHTLVEANKTTVMKAMRVAILRRCISPPGDSDVNFEIAPVIESARWVIVKKYRPEVADASSSAHRHWAAA